MSVLIPLGLVAYISAFLLFGVRPLALVIGPPIEKAGGTIWRQSAPAVRPLRFLRLPAVVALMAVVLWGMAFWIGMMAGYLQTSEPRVCAYLPLPQRPGISAPICEQGITHEEFDRRVGS